MPSRFRVSPSRALAGVAMLTTLVVLGVGNTAATGAAPHGGTAVAGAAHVTAGPGRKGDSVIRLISWSGRPWLVYSNASNGPEHVKLTNSTRAIWVDSRGRLHLHIVKIDGVWRSVELRSLNTVSYGTYRLV
ncbi:MAG TPA: hypothetical protein VHC43_12245, partial [Mycobacteriales bacterium]|nr:hypothetical protein [Mycobacteriales bacterium]